MANYNYTPEETSAILKGMANKISQDDCSPLDAYNMKMFAALLGGADIANIDHLPFAGPTTK